jgi:sugar O-acyltransferase (sialic acid O-acetyltransferase NeuD family)
MSFLKYIVVPKENANDTEVLVVSIVEDGANVDCNLTILAEFEGSKAVTEFVSPHSGFFYALCNAGDKIKVSNLFGIISDKILCRNQIDEIKSNYFSNNSLENEENNKISLSKTTAPALELMKAHGLSDKNFSGIEIIKKSDVEKYLIDSGIKINNKSRPELYQKINRIAIIGAGTGGLIAADIIGRQSNARLIGLYDDDDSFNSLLGFPILGKINATKIFHDFKSGLFDAVIVTLGSRVDFKDRVFNELVELGINFHNAIHPSCIIAENVNLGIGNLIAANTVIGAFAELGKNNFISSSCVIEHHNRLGNSGSFGPGVMLSGTVEIRDRVLFGTGVFVEPYTTIDSDCVISSGSIITTRRTTAPPPLFVGITA